MGHVDNFMVEDPIVDFPAKEPLKETKSILTTSNVQKMSKIKQPKVEIEDFKLLDGHIKNEDDKLKTNVEKLQREK